MPIDTSIFQQIKSIDDYKRAAQEFELQKQLKQAQIQENQAKAAAAVANPGGSLPATLQVNNAIQKALQQGDAETANRIAWLHRSGAYGVDTFGNQMSIPEQMARNAGMKSGAQELAQLQQKAIYEPNIAKQTAIQKQKAQQELELGERVATLPQLEGTTQELSELGQRATYTKAGQALDYLRSQAGLEPRKGAVARTEYMSLVDNQILPLLRQTFGAQFTQQEGQSLKTTLGDPNLSPQQKDAVLRSFINQKKATINSMERQLGIPETSWDISLTPEESANIEVMQGPAESRRIGRSDIPMAAIQDLKKNPKTASQFDEIFGAGSAQWVLGK